jgi:hypothetical protein
MVEICPLACEKKLTTYLPSSGSTLVRLNSMLILGFTRNLVVDSGILSTVSHAIIS